MMAKINYYADLDYEKLPTAKKRRIHYDEQPSPVILDSPTIIYDIDESSSPPTTILYTPVSQNGSASMKPREPLASIPRETLTTSQAKQPVGSTNINNNSHNNNNYSSYSNSNSYSNSCGYSNSSSYSNSCSYSNSSSYSNFSSASIINKSQTTTVTKELLMMTLKRYFKFDSFRENQFEAVDATCKGLDTLILMPTGGGKSICYQLPAVLSEGVSIVVSPLKSLIADQVDRLRRSNIRTFALFGDTPDQEVQEILADLQQAQPNVKLLYVTPEKISASNQLINIFDKLYKRNLLARFVIDEAHCVSMWGSDFRPDYRKLNKLRQLFPNVPIMALTATAPPKVRLDILDQLMMDKLTSKIFIQSFNRPNLKFEVRMKSKGCVAEICNMIHANFTRQCGIIYCLSRADCENLAEKLRERGIASAPYHAGLNNEHRNRVFNAWSRGSFQVVCATIAFGMGIDKSDVRFVIHYSMPKSLEGYYQEAGRAGRDGKFASCILYFSKGDLWRMKSMLGKTGFGRKKEDKERDTANLQPMIDYVDNRGECRRTVLLRYLGEKFDSQDCIRDLRTACDNCLARQNGA